MPNKAMERAELADLIYRSCLLLDDMDIEGFMRLCAPEFRYQICAYSSEILKDMLWKDIDKEELRKHLQLVPRHVYDPNPLSRYVYTVAYGDGQANVVTGIQVFKTQLDGGRTELYAIGRYHDTFRPDGDTALLTMRKVRLTTRDLGTGSPIPF